MADNINIKDSADATVAIAGDLISGALYQRIKTGYGADGSYTEMDVQPATQATLEAIRVLASALATETKLEAVRLLLAGTLGVSGPLTDAQLRAVAVAISAASLPLPTGAASESKLEAVRALLAGTLTVTGGGGGPATVADGADVALGATTDTAVYTDTSGTISGKLRGLVRLVASVISAGLVQIRALTASDVVTATGGAGQTADVKVTLDGETLPLPSGASTSAKQPALGTAGTPSADVLTVQGVTSMTPIKVDGSGVNQPVSGTFWQTTQPVSLESLPALVAGSATIGAVTFPALSRASSKGTPITTSTNTTAVAAPGSGKYLCIHRIHVTCKSATEVTVYWREGAAGDMVFPVCLASKGATISLSLNGTWSLPENTALVIYTDAASSVEWQASYRTLPI